MDILEYAMQVEKEGEAHYRELAEHSNNPGVSRILTELADSEVEHYQVFKAFKESTEIPEIDDAVLPNVKEIFSKMQADQTLAAGEDELALYRSALIHEKKSQEFYQKQAEQAESPVLKVMLLKIAQEEAMHYKVLEGIIDFLSAPAQWLESAEWNHLSEEY
ncbi:MAG: ferritin family protein [Sedimenticola sp.]